MGASTCTTGRDYLTGSDSVMLTLESPTSIFNMILVAFLDSIVSKEDGLKYTAEMAQSFGDRFLRRLVLDKRHGGIPYFEHDPEFDVKNHYSYQELPASTNLDGLISVALNDFAADGYPTERPLWAVRLFKIGEDRCGLSIKVHHAICDGQGFSRVLSMWAASYTPNNGGLTRSRNYNVLRAEPPATSLAPSQDELDGMMQSAQDKVVKYGEKRIAPYPESEHASKYPIITKQAASASALPIKELRRLKTLAGATNVNDVVVALVVGALTRTLKAKKYPVDEHYNFTIPKSFRTDADPDLQNFVGWYSIFVPSNVTSVSARSRLISQIMKENKDAPDAEVAYRHMRSQVHPWDLDQDAEKESFTRTHASISNVPPPDYPFHFGHSKMTLALPVGPITSPGMTNISLLTNEGKMVMVAQMEEDREAGKGNFYARGAAREFCDAYEAEFKMLQQEIASLEKGGGNSIQTSL